MFSKPLDTLLTLDDDQSTSNNDNSGEFFCDYYNVEQEFDPNILESDKEYQAFNENPDLSSDESDSSEAIIVKKQSRCSVKPGSKEGFSSDILR